jgi:hypothetical protein
VIGRPLSNVSKAARVASREATMSAIRCRTPARSRAFIRGHGPDSNAADAAATAASTSACWPAAAVA